MFFKVLPAYVKRIELVLNTCNLFKTGQLKQHLQLKNSMAILIYCTKIIKDIEIQLQSMKEALQRRHT